MSGSRRRRDRDDWSEGGGKDWGNWGVACLYCGERFYGGVSKASRQCANHTTIEHPGETPHYVAFASPLTYEAEKQARFMGTVNEAVALERIMREHGSGWYFYALHYGVAEADDHIRRVAETEGERVEKLRDMVKHGQDA